MPLDLGIKELGPWKPYVRRLLRTIHDELLRVLRLLDELPSAYYRDLESLLDRMGEQEVDRRTDTVYGRDGSKFRPTRLP
ncbi:hypothetical protein HDU99_007350, partial [Rhizoclosmatium hyalinum]